MKAYYKKENFIFEIEYDKKIQAIRIVEKENLGEKSDLSDFAFKEISDFLDGKLEKFPLKLTLKAQVFKKVYGKK